MKIKFTPYIIIFFISFIPFYIVLAAKGNNTVMIGSIIISLIIVSFLFVLYYNYEGQKNNNINNKNQNNNTINNNKNIEQKDKAIYLIKNKSNLLNNEVIKQEIIEKTTSLFSEIVDVYNIAKSDVQLIRYIKGALNRNNLYLYSHFNFMLTIPNDIISNILYIKKENDQLIRNDNLIVKYLIKICVAISQYYNVLFFDKEYLQKLNFLSDDEYNEKQGFDKLITALIEAGVIENLFTHKFVILYLMFEERNKILANEFKEKFLLFPFNPSFNNFNKDVFPDLLEPNIIKFLLKDREKSIF